MFCIDLKAISVLYKLFTCTSACRVCGYTGVHTSALALFQDVFGVVRVKRSLRSQGLLSCQNPKSRLILESLPEPQQEGNPSGKNVHIDLASSWAFLAPGTVDLDSEQTGVVETLQWVPTVPWPQVWAGVLVSSYCECWLLRTEIPFPREAPLGQWVFWPRNSHPHTRQPGANPWVVQKAKPLPQRRPTLWWDSPCSAPLGIRQRLGSSQGHILAQ